MDRKRRISSIICHFKEIEEEKQNLSSSLERIHSQLNKIVDALSSNNNESIKSKDLQEIYNYELLVLKTLSDINFNLEAFTEENTLKVEVNQLTNCSNQTKISNSNNGCEQTGACALLTSSNSLKVKVEEPENCLPSTSSVSPTRQNSRMMEVNGIQGRNDDDNDSLENIQTLKLNLRKLIEKSGYTEEALLQMQDVIAKPANDSFDAFPAIPLHGTNNSNNPFEYPEKETKDCNSTSTTTATSSSISTTTSDSVQIATVQDKLANLNVRDRRLEILRNSIVELQMPNLEMLPQARAQENVMQNLFNYPLDNVDANKKVKEKKKERKEKKKNKERSFYIIKGKNDPQAGMECAFSYIEAPNLFYIHMVDAETSAIDRISESIGNLYQSSKPPYASKNEACTKLGSYCCVHIIKKDYDRWYRAFITDWRLEQSDDAVQIQLIDYGNNDLVSYKNLRKLNMELAKLPKLAIKCHLPLIYPPESTFLNRLTVWPDATIDALKNLSGLDEDCNKLFKIVYAEREGDSIAIDFYNPEEADEEHTIGQILLDLGLAVQIFEDVDNDQLELEEFIQDVDSIEEPENINEAITGYDPHDEARVCFFTKPDGTCYKGKNCKLEHRILPKGGYTTDQIPVFRCAFDDLQVPRVNESINVLLTEPINACSYYALLIRKPKKLQSYFIDQDLHSLIELMNSRKMLKRCPKFKVWPALGEVVLVLHWTKKWLRGIVRDFVNNRFGEIESVHIFLVDFGDEVHTPLSKLRQINEEFLHLPFQAVEVYLAGYQQKNNICESEWKEFFNDNLAYRNFMLHNYSLFPPLKVNIYSLKGEDVGKRLQELGFVEGRCNDLLPVESCGFDLE